MVTLIARESLLSFSVNISKASPRLDIDATCPNLDRVPATSSPGRTDKEPQLHRILPFNLSKWNRIMKDSILVKTLFMVCIAGVLLFPMAMIRDLVSERQARRDTVLADIATGWGRQQSVAGPWLNVSYERYWTEVFQETVNEKTVERKRERMDTGVLRIPVDQVHWTAAVSASEKARGIHKARLYSAQISASGNVTIPARFGIEDAKARYQFSKPYLTIGIADPKGIRSTSQLAFGPQVVSFMPGLGDLIGATGIHAPLDIAVASESRSYPFRFSFELAGAESLTFAPIARDASFAMHANWAHPSFFGPFLPSKHAIDDSAFPRNGRFRDSPRWVPIASGRASETRIATPFGGKNSASRSSSRSVSTNNSIGLRNTAFCLSGCCSPHSVCSSCSSEWQSTRFNTPSLDSHCRCSFCC
jgi:hypothetical protein